MKVNAVSLNETGYYTLKGDKEYIKEIRGVYAYNPNSCTHLCELTPSYDLRYLYTYIVFADDVGDDKQGELSERYCNEPNEDTYMHCRDVQRCEGIKECGEFEDMESAVEYLQGNYPI